MKLRLPNKLIAAIVAAASPVLFSTLSTATLGAAAVATLGQQAAATDYSTVELSGTGTINQTPTRNTYYASTTTSGTRTIFNISSEGDEKYDLKISTTNKDEKALGTIKANDLLIADSENHNSRLRYDSASNLSGVNSLTFGGGQLWVATALNFSGNMFINGRATYTGDSGALRGAVIRVNNDVTLSGKLQVENVSTDDALITWQANDKIFAVQGALCGSGNLNLSSYTSERGTMRLLGDNSGFTGEVNVASTITLQVASDLTLSGSEKISDIEGSLVLQSGSTLTVSNGATLDVSATNATQGKDKGLTINGSRVVVKDGGVLMVGQKGVGVGYLKMLNGSLTATKINTAWGGGIFLTGGTLEITGDGKALDKGTATNGADVLLDGSLVLKAASNWTVDKADIGGGKLNIGTVTIDHENTGAITFKGATYTGTIVNNAQLNLAGSAAVNLNNLSAFRVFGDAVASDFSGADHTSEGGQDFTGSGLMQGSDTRYYLVQGGNGSTLDTTSLGTLTGLTRVQGVGSANDYIFTLTESARPANTYFINSSLNYDDNEMGSAETLNIAQGQSLSIGNATVSSAKKLVGSGTYKLKSGTTAMTSNVSIGDMNEWRGIVQMSDVSLAVAANLSQATYSNPYSFVGLSGVTGVDSAWQGGTITANISFENSAAGYAWNYDNGAGATHYTRTFSGTIIGDGELKKGSTHRNDFAFTGDISGWTGSFNYASATEDGSTITFDNAATTINAVVKNTANTGIDVANGLTLALAGGSKTAFTFNNTVTVTKLKGAEREMILGSNTKANGTTTNGVLTVNGTAELGKLTLTTANAAATLKGSVSAVKEIDIQRGTVTIWSDTVRAQSINGTVTLGNGAKLVAHAQQYDGTNNFTFNTIALQDQASATIATEWHGSPINLQKLVGTGTLELQNNVNSTAHATFSIGGAATTETDTTFHGTLVLNQATGGNNRGAVIVFNDEYSAADAMLTVKAQNAFGQTRLLGIGLNCETVKLQGINDSTITSPSSDKSLYRIFSGSGTGLPLALSDDISYFDNAADGEIRTLELTGEGTYSTAAQIGSNINLLKSGTGTQTFTGNIGNFNGDVGISSGTLALNGAGEATMKKLTMSGGKLSYGGSGSLTTTGAALSDGNISVTSSGALTINGTQTMALGTLNVSNGGSLSFAGASVSASALEIRGANAQVSFTHMLTVAGSRVDVGYDNASTTGAVATFSGGLTVTGETSFSYALVVGAGNKAILGGTSAISGYNLGAQTDGEIVIAESASVTADRFYNTKASNGKLTVEDKASITLTGASTIQKLVDRGTVTLQANTTVNTSLHLEGGTLNLTGGTTTANTIWSNGDGNTISLSGNAVLQTTMAGDNCFQVKGTDTLTIKGNARLNLTTNTSEALTVKAQGSATASLTGTTDFYTVGQTATTITNADVTFTKASDATLSNKLTGSAIINSGSGTLTVNNAANTLVGVDAEGGAITVQNAATSAGTLKSIVANGGNVTIQGLGESATVNLTELTIAGSKTVSAYTGTPTADQIAAAQNGSNTAVEATLAISNGTLTAGSGAKLNAHLSLGSDTTLDIADATVGGAGLTMGSTVTIEQGAKVKLSDNIISGLNSLTVGSGLTLFSGVDSFSIGGDNYDPTATYTASDYFNLAGVNTPSDFVIKYGPGIAALSDGTNQAGQSIFIWREMPEPATSTLSLLALAALAARRKRK